MRKLLALVAALLVPLAFAPPAEAFIYWTTHRPDAIGRAKLNGNAVDRGFINDLGGSLAALAVDDTYVYWSNPTNPQPGAIGRAKLDGTEVNESFVSTGDPYWIAVSDAHVYWTHNRGRIGRVNLDGTQVDQEFIKPPLVGAATAVAVNDTHVYWTHRYNGAIGRARLNGGRVERKFVTFGARPEALAVDDKYVYWTNNRGRIGRAKLDGTRVNSRFITGVAERGSESLVGLTVNARHVYWANHDTHKIGRAKLDGTRVNPRFIRAGHLDGLAVGPGRG